MTHVTCRATARTGSSREPSELQTTVTGVGAMRRILVRRGVAATGAREGDA